MRRCQLNRTEKLLSIIFRDHAWSNSCSFKKFVVLFQKCKVHQKMHVYWLKVAISPKASTQSSLLLVKNLILFLIENTNCTVCVFHCLSTHSQTLKTA